MLPHRIAELRAMRGALPGSAPRVACMEWQRTRLPCSEPVCSHNGSIHTCTSMPVLAVLFWLCHFRVVSLLVETCVIIRWLWRVLFLYRLRGGAVSSVACSLSSFEAEVLRPRLDKEALLARNQRVWHNANSFMLSCRPPGTGLIVIWSFVLSNASSETKVAAAVLEISFRIVPLSSVRLATGNGKHLGCG